MVALGSTHPLPRKLEIVRPIASWNHDHLPPLIFQSHHPKLAYWPPFLTLWSYLCHHSLHPTLELLGEWWTSILRKFQDTAAVPWPKGKRCRNPTIDVAVFGRHESSWPTMWQVGKRLEKYGKMTLYNWGIKLGHGLNQHETKGTRNQSYTTFPKKTGETTPNWGHISSLAHFRCHNVSSIFPEWHVSMALLW